MMRLFSGPVALLLLFFINLCYIQSAAADTQKPVRGVYFKIEPDVVVNYGDTGPLRFIRAEISLGLVNVQATPVIRRHKAYIRNNIIMFLSAQTPDVIKDPSSRQTLRQELLTEIQELMKELEGEYYVNQLYFTNFIVQS